MELLTFMAAPLVATLLMGGILVYFGIHVIKREIVFIDIALAQIAALGGVVALIVWPHDHNAHGHEGEHHLIEYLFALLFTTLAAGLFSIIKNKKVKIPLEALIGISYAVATTAMVIILDKGAGSDVHIHDMLTGAILWVTWGQILRLGVIVFFVALFHFFARKQMMGLTDNYHNNDFNPNKKKLWDFLFYFSFGLVIVEAVQIGGILTVFALLMIPASTILLFYSSWKARILSGLLLSGLLTIPALWLSWTWDVPASPVLIFFLGIALVIGGIIYRLRNKMDQK
ncbi:MAG: metal ABC transporter permease [Bacteroidota bacterium]|nr:metal ABC transporter permease [Bacteroidota bacterium]